MVPSGSRRLQISRRRLLIGSAAFGGTMLGASVPNGLAAPGVITSDRERPQIPYGVMSGDPTGSRAIIWSKTDRPARMLLEFATREDFRGAQRVVGPAALASSDTTHGSIWDRFPGCTGLLSRKLPGFS
jgi:alkaline phosphatase D